MTTTTPANEQTREPLSYLQVWIDKSLVTKLKHRAVDNDQPIRKLVEDILRDALEGTGQGEGGNNEGVA